MENWSNRVSVETRESGARCFESYGGKPSWEKIEKNLLHISRGARVMGYIQIRLNDPPLCIFCQMLGCKYLTYRTANHRVPNVPSFLLEDDLKGNSFIVLLLPHCWMAPEILANTCAGLRSRTEFQCKFRRVVAPVVTERYDCELRFWAVRGHFSWTNTCTSKRLLSESWIY